MYLQNSLLIMKNLTCLQVPAAARQEKLFALDAERIEAS